MKYCRVCLTILILLNLTFRQELVARQVQSHLVPLEEPQSQLEARSGQRLQDIQEIEKMLRHHLVQKQIGNLVALEKVELALGTLDDETLKQLADESRKVNDQLQAGVATWGWVLIALIAAITIIAVVGAVTWDSC